MGEAPHSPRKGTFPSLDIIHRILKAIRDESKHTKTHIKNATNLNTESFERYLNHLLHYGYITTSPSGRPVLLQRGLQTLRGLDEISVQIARPQDEQDA